MNERERVLAALTFGEVDRIPFWPGSGRRSTIEAWRTQGLPKDIESHQVAGYALGLVGGKPEESPAGGDRFYVNERMIPQFEEKVIERRENTQIVQDWKGNICEIGNEFTIEHLRYAIDFVTRRWIKCPVETRSDWEAIKKRYNPDDPLRYPENPAELGKRLEGRSHFLELQFSGPFWQLREWLGFERLCEMFYDDPEFIGEMVYFWQEYIARLLDNTLRHFVPDCVHISEDMAYKSFSMISPDMTRRYLLPVWKRWGQIIRNAGVPVYAVDSDGYIGELIPIWIEAGVNACDPIEVAAGCDLVEFRKKFGKNMAYRGGVDKRAMAKGGRVIEAEIQRLLPVINDGGYIPGCDHGIPSDVSWPDFLHYADLLARATRWK